jgi:hypothetical protein
VVGGPGVLLLLGADEGAVLDPGDVARVRGGIVGVGALLLVEPGERALVDKEFAQALVLGFRAVAPLDSIRLGELCDLLHPGEQPFVLRGRGGGQGRVLVRHDRSVSRRIVLDPALGLRVIAA